MTAGGDYSSITVLTPGSSSFNRLPNPSASNVRRRSAAFCRWWIQADRQDGSCADGLARCQPRDLAAGGSAGEVLRGRTGEGGM